MFLGRNTIQWTALIGSFVSALQIILPIIAPTVDPVQIATILGTIGVLLGALIAFIANSSTTPVGDPQLKEGTIVRVTNEAGTIIGHEPVPSPTTPAPGGNP